jgi:Putative transposase
VIFTKQTVCRITIPTCYSSIRSMPTTATLSNAYNQLVNHAGFSLHVGVMAEAHRGDKLERLCRYISRPAASEKRLALIANGQVRYELKTPFFTHRASDSISNNWHTRCYCLAFLYRHYQIPSSGSGCKLRSKSLLSSRILLSLSTFSNT